MTKRKTKTLPKPQAEFDYEADLRNQVETDLANVEAEFPGDRQLGDLCADVRSAIQNGSAIASANAAFHLGWIWTFRRFSRDGTLPAALKQIRRTSRRKRTEKTKAELEAQQAHDLLEKEKAEAGRYFDRGTAIKEIARKLGVEPVTVNRRLKRYARQS